MPFSPAVAEGEVVLVSCHDTTQRGVKFHVVLTDRRLIHARPTMLSTDGIVTESHPLPLAEVALESVAPYARWGFGAFCALGFCVYVAGIAFNYVDRASWYLGALMFGAAATAFGTARRRLRLGFRAGAKRFSLTTPGGSNAPAESLREIHALITDENRHALKVRERKLEVESEQDREPDDL